MSPASVTLLNSLLFGAEGQCAPLKGGKTIFAQDDNIQKGWRGLRTEATFHIERVSKTTTVKVALVLSPLCLQTNWLIHVYRADFDFCAHTSAYQQCPAHIRTKWCRRNLTESWFELLTNVCQTDLRQNLLQIQRSQSRAGNSAIYKHFAPSAGESCWRRRH